MTRIWLAPFALMVTMGAGPAPAILPVPPIPPDNPPSEQSAPVPDPDIRAPLAGGQAGVQFSLQDFRVDRYDQSPGYSPGSHFQSSEDKRPIQTPGLSLTLPLR